MTIPVPLSMLHCKVERARRGNWKNGGRLKRQRRLAPGRRRIARSFPACLRPRRPWRGCVSDDDDVAAKIAGVFASERSLALTDGCGARCRRRRAPECWKQAAASAMNCRLRGRPRCRFERASDRLSRRLDSHESTSRVNLDGRAMRAGNRGLSRGGLCGAARIANWSLPRSKRSSARLVIGIIYSTDFTREVSPARARRGSDVLLIAPRKRKVSLRGAGRRDRRVCGDVASHSRKKVIGASASSMGEPWMEASARGCGGYRRALEAAQIAFGFVVVRDGDWLRYRGAATRLPHRADAAADAIFCANDSDGDGGFGGGPQAVLRVPKTFRHGLRHRTRPLYNPPCRTLVLANYEWAAAPWNC